MRQRISVENVQKNPSTGTRRQTPHEQLAQAQTSLFSSMPEPMSSRITRTKADLVDLKAFYNIEASPLRYARLKLYFSQQIAELQSTDFGKYDQDGKIDYLLFKNYLKRELRQLELDVVKNEKMAPILPFAPEIMRLCEERQQMKGVDGQQAARDVHAISLSAAKSIVKISNPSSHEDSELKNIDRSTAYRAANTINALRGHLEEWFYYFNGYDPLFSWWVKVPYAKLDTQLLELAAVVREKLVGINPGDADAIVGEPIGISGLQADLDAEMIPYSPRELIEIGEKEYAWCEAEMIKASKELGYGDNWRDALEHVKDLYVPAGKQTDLVRCLALEASSYVKKHDLVTVPEIAEESYRMFMMSPAAQKVNPFFLGGEDIIVSYPTAEMDHDAKLMSMRGNNIHFSRSTVFHEMIPGHHLQFHYIERYKPYRQMFDTPFWMEGWALYWEFLLWDRGFPATPENKIGMLFWRMHRCARIIFSIKFHLGEMAPQECIDMLVNWVGHERENAEGEVRRSFNGDYTPLYQAGYMLGALQLWSLREAVMKGGMKEKDFHDAVMRNNEMPIEMLRALITGQDVKEEFESEWRFYQSTGSDDD